MLRWSILIVTLIAWLVCMRFVYVKFGPQVSHNIVTANTAALDNLFDDNGDVAMSWDVYVRPSEINDSNILPFSGMDTNLNGSAHPKKDPPPHVEWNGVDETGLTHVGRLDTNMKRKFTRVEQTANLNLVFPEELRIPDPLRKIRMESRADFSLDQGLEYCNAKLSVGDMLDAYALGLRSGSEMFITKDVSFDGKQAYHATDRLPVGERSAPMVDVTPFQRNKDIQVKYSWDLVQLDLSSIDMSSAAEPKLTSMKVTCTGKTQIKHRGSLVTVFEVRSEDGTARAWYSADGVVLKQTYVFLGLFDVFIIRNGGSRGKPAVSDGDESGEN